MFEFRSEYANTGMPEGEVTAEIERYIVNPGQACTYKVGELKILDQQVDRYIVSVLRGGH